MSYTTFDANFELGERMATCVETRDVEEAYEIANILKETNDDELAEKFRTYASTWEREDNYHDEVIGN